MASSDNVVRAGLTPKHKDVDTLVNMLTYDYGPADAQILRGTSFRGSSFTFEYDPPIDEFTVLRTNLKMNQVEKMSKINGPSIILGIEGSGIIESNGISYPISAGFVYFVSANVDLDIKASNEDLLLYRAFCEISS